MSVKISVITPTFNSEKTIEETVRSVLSQERIEFEHWIIDNVSRDSTLARVRTLYEKAGKLDRLHIVSEKDQGISDAFNRGIRAATGEIVAILNSDDCYADSKVFERVANAFENREVQIVHGSMLFEDPVHGTNVRRPLLCPLTQAMPINHPTMFVRREAYERFGLYSLKYRYAMDFEWLCRLYSSPNQISVKAVYLDGPPLSKMLAGGASYAHELKSLDEVERALNERGFFGLDARRHLLARRLRVKLKGTLSAFGLGSMIRVWRNWKWET